jgi:hypothetical protein
MEMNRIGKPGLTGVLLAGAALALPEAAGVQTMLKWASPTTPARWRRATR